MRRLPWMLLVAGLAPAAACGDEIEGCPYGIFSCTDDDDCYPAPLPRGKCLDDHAGARICGLYFETCPTKLRFANCGGTNGKLSPWAGRCVRPELLPDASTPADMLMPTDMSATADDGGPG